FRQIVPEQSARQAVGARADLLGARRELAAPGIDAAQDHLDPLREGVARDRALPVDDAPDPLDARQGLELRDRAPAEDPALAAQRMDDHRRVAAHQLALDVAPIA